MSSSLNTGSILRSRYKVDRVIYEAMLVNVYHVYDLHMQGKTWAMREMQLVSADPREKAAIVNKFKKEASILASVSHPCVSTIIDFFADGNYLYIIREYVSGTDIGTLAKQQQAPFNPEDVINWSVQLTDALNYLYLKKLPPSFFKEFNRSHIIVMPKGKIKLVDMGLAKIFLADTALENLSRLSACEYPAPEQFAEEPFFDARSLVYSIGGFMYHLLTNVNPASSPFELRAPSLLNPNISRSLQDIIKKATETDPKKRYATLADLKKSLISVSKGKITKYEDKKNSDKPLQGALFFFLVSVLVGILGFLGYFFFIK